MSVLAKALHPAISRMWSDPATGLEWAVCGRCGLPGQPSPGVADVYLRAGMIVYATCVCAKPLRQSARCRGCDRDSRDHAAGCPIAAQHAPQRRRDPLPCGYDDGVTLKIGDCDSTWLLFTLACQRMHEAGESVTASAFRAAADSFWRRMCIPCRRNHAETIKADLARAAQAAGAGA